MSSEWPTTFLRDLITYKKGFAFKSSDYQSEGVPVIRVSNFTDNSISSQDLKFISPAVASSNSDVMLRHKDIVIATVGSWPNNPASVVGRTISVPSWAAGSCMNQNSVIIRTKSGDLSDQEFIYYQMKTKDFAQHIISKAQGSANQASITLDAIFSYQLSWPNYSERRSITKFLTALDERITLLRETNATLEAIAQALFKSWFVDFDPVHANAHARAQHQNSHPQAVQQNPAPHTAEANAQNLGLDAATAALFPDHFQDSDLGPIPAGWEVHRLDSQLKIAYGKNLPTTKLLDEGYPVFGGNGVIGYIDKYLYETRQVLVACRGAASGKVNQSTPKAFVTNNSLVLEETQSLPFGYLKGYMRSSDLTPYVTGSAQPQVTIDNLGKFKIIVPSLAVVSKYEFFSKQIEDTIESNNLQAQTLTQLRDTLLPRLISGQLRLPEAEAQIEAVVGGA